MATAHPTEARPAYPADSTPGRTPTTRTEKGISLARGPALVLGTILTAAGLYFLYKAHIFAKFSSFPNGTAHIDGKFFLGIFGVNGWSAMLTAVAGALLLFGAASHLLAKTMSLIVGACLAAAALIALFSSGNILGMGAANHLTELGWGVCAVILLFNTLAPRRTRTVVVADEPARTAPATAAPVREPVTRTGAADAPVREPVARTGATDAPVHEPATTDEATAAPVREPVAAATPAAGAPDEAVVRHAALRSDPAPADDQ
jgi:hypothetical protein